MNLESALRHLRHESEELVIWVDALCINQKDLAEKNSQVQKMASVFRQAKMVICWLGEETDDSHLAFCTIKDWGDALLRHGLGDLQQADKLFNPRLYQSEFRTIWEKEIVDPFNVMLGLQ